jgi:hypothetical protein
MSGCNQSHLARMVFRLNQRSRTILRCLKSCAWASSRCCVDQLRPPGLPDIDPLLLAGWSKIKNFVRNHLGLELAACLRGCLGRLVRCARGGCLEWLAGVGRGVGWLCEFVRGAADSCAVASGERTVISRVFAMLHFGALHCGALMMA